MATRLTVLDETPNGEQRGSLDLQLPSERTTLREVIRERVYQEVQDFNLQHRKVFRGLVRPEGAVSQEDGFLPRSGQSIDWKRQFEAAMVAFSRNGFFVLVDDEQVIDLDAAIEVKPGTRVTFVKLVPLVGG